MKNSKKSKLKVTPVKRYNRAKYPRFDDPNPVDHPDTLPYPFSEKVIKILCGMGLGVLLLNSPDEPLDFVPEIFTLEKRDSTSNPFSDKMIGLPYIPSGFGTGIPSRLRREEAIGVINRVFREEEIPLDEMIDVKKDGVVLTADGYNEQMKIGFVFIDYSRLGEGTIQNNWSRNFERKLNNVYIYPNEYRRAESFVNKESYSYKELSEKDNPQSKAFLHFIDKVYPTLYSFQQKKRFKKQFLIYTLYNQLEMKRQVSPNFSTDVRQYLERKGKLSIKELEKFSSTLSMLRQVNKKYPKLKDGVLVNELIASIDLSDRKWKKQMNNFYVLLYAKKVANRTRNNDFLKLIEKALEQSGKEQQDTFKEIQSTIDLIEVDLQEIKNLNKASDKNKYFIAPINQQDPRFTFHGNNRRRSSERLLKLLESQFAETTDPVKKEKQRKRIEELKKELTKERVDPRERSLTLLEDQVRNYIHWAKGQMGY